MIPAIGHKAGDVLDFGGLLGHAPIMPISQYSPEMCIRDRFWSPCCRKMSLPDPPPEFYSNGRGLAGEHQLQYIAGYYGDKAEERLHAVWADGGEQIKKGVPCKPGLKELLSYLEDLGLSLIHI